MSDLDRLLQRQARWQRSRRHLSWAEKIRMVEKVRASIALLQDHTATKHPQDRPGPAQAPPAREE